MLAETAVGAEGVGLVAAAAEAGVEVGSLVPLVVGAVTPFVEAAELLALAAANCALFNRTT